MENEKFYTLKQAAELFSVSVRTLRRWIKEGKIKSFRVGKLIRISQEEVQRLKEGK